MTDVLQVNHVNKRFASVQAVDDITFRVKRGEIFALLGPNGAGKTTLVRMLLGIIRPDDGSIQFQLHDEPAPPAPHELGYLPEDRGLYKDIPIRRTLIFFARLRGMEKADAETAADEWLERMDLTERAKEKLDALSKGNQQKVQFIASILHRPAFAVLDEPFSGLDPLNQDFFLEIVRELRDQGMTILLSAHQMALVERIADRILLMNHGHEVRCGTLGELRASVELGTRITFHIRGTPNLSELRAHPAVTSVHAPQSDQVEVEVRRGEPLGALLQTAGQSLDIVEVRSQPPALHDIYIQALKQAGEPIKNGEVVA